MARIFIVEQNALGVGGHYFAYTGCVARAAINAGLKAVILQNVRQTTSWGIPGATVISAFTRTWGEAERAGPTGWGPGDLVYEMLAATSSAPPTAGDHVLFHTLGQVELRSVLSYLSKIPPSDHIPTFHVLLRYDPNELGHTIIALEPVLAHIRTARHLRRAVRFHTDTDQLTRVYARMTRLPFSTLPIPFAQAELRRHIAEAPPRAPGAPITFIYLGDARLEKNFHYLPSAISHIWARFGRAGRARFVLQSNFNTPGGEQGQLAAVQRLGQFPSNRVRLIEAPMDQADYYAELASADAVFVPYSAQRYRERSSGVLVEAMAAGKPVITSTGSWMESFVSRDHAVLFDDPADLGAAVEEMIVNFDRYHAGAMGIRDSMLDWSSGDHFVAELLKGKAPTADDSRPNALVIMNGDAVVLQNGSSQIARSQFEYFSAAGFRVTGLFLTKARRANNEDIETFTEALLAATNTLPMDDCHVAAPGRLSADILAQSVARSLEEPSVEADLALASFYDYNSSTLHALRRHRPDVILLNYVTNVGVIDALGLDDVPLICEMHDIQSFQKAIYGERSVSSRDLQMEMELLARCDYLISLNEAETRLVREWLPAVPCSTSGVFSSARPATFADLAGCKDIAELVSSTGPQLPALRYDDSWQSGNLDALRHRLAFPRVDLLFVSSSHLANVSGLRWFLENVYGPYLAPVGVRMLVAGSIFYHGEWPMFDGLLFTGQVDNLAPLYAAARIVVLPIIEGAGSPVKTFEAMRYVRPIVATPMALRGIEETLDGILVASEPAEFAEHVLRLVRSPGLRTECRARIAASTQKLIDPARYRTVMNEAVSHLLGDTAPTAPVDGAVPLIQTEVEWDGETVALNRLIRQLLDDEELGWTELRLLAKTEPARLGRRMDEILGALLIDQNAPILKTEARVRDRLQAMYRRFPDIASYVAPLLRHAIAYADLDQSLARAFESGGPAAFMLFVHSRLPLKLLAVTRGKVAALTVDGARIDPISTHGLDRRHVAAFDLPALPDTPYDFVVRDVRVIAGEDPPEAVVVIATIGVGRPFATFGTPLIADQAESAMLFLSADRVRTVNLPRLGGLYDGTLVVDLFFVDDFGIDATLTASHSGLDLSPTLAVAEGRPVRRILLDHLGERTPLGLLPLSLRIAGSFADGEGVAIERVRLSLVAGLAATEALALIEESGSTSAALTEDGGLPAPVRTRLRELLTYAAAAKPLPLNSANVLRAIARLPQGPAALHDAARSIELETFGAGGQIVDLPGLIDRVLFPIETLAAADMPGFVAAPGVDVTCTASFDGSASEGTCRIYAALVAAGASTPIARVGWHHIIEWRDKAGQPIVPAGMRLTFSFPASLSSVAGEEKIVAENVYWFEQRDDGENFRWTGPSPTTSFLLPLAVTAPGELRITVVMMGENQPEDIAVRINGKPAPTSVEMDSNGISSVIRAPLAVQDGPATTLVELVHRRLFRPSSQDLRRLGVAFGRIEIELSLEAACPTYVVTAGDVVEPSF